MEPNMNDIDDFNKPLPWKKRRLILLAFMAAIAIYFVYVMLLKSL